MICHMKLTNTSTSAADDIVPAHLFRTDSLRSGNYAAVIAIRKLDLQSTQQPCSYADSVYLFFGRLA